MVGGFAESPYIYKKIQTFAEANGLQAIRPPNACVITAGRYHFG